MADFADCKHARSGPSRVTHQWVAGAQMTNIMLCGFKNHCVTETAAIEMREMGSTRHRSGLLTYDEYGLDVEEQAEYAADLE